MKQHQIPAGVPPMELGRYLRRAYPMLPERLLKETLRRRDVRVNGIKCPSEWQVRGGDDIALYIPDDRFDLSLSFAFDDGRLLLPVKPQGLPVDADQDGVGQDTLLTRLRMPHPGARLCNRLDAATGGLVVAAVGSVYDDALAAFQRKEVEKTYVALAKGGFSRREDVLNAFLLKDPKSSTVRVLSHPAPGARPIETRCRVLGDDGHIAALALNPVTGRTHQLRAHMASLGHPLLGDDKYGDRALNRDFGGPLRLWCAALRFSPAGSMSAYSGGVFRAPLPAWAEPYRIEEALL